MQSSGLACMIAKRVNHLQVLRGTSGGNRKPNPRRSNEAAGVRNIALFPPAGFLAQPTSMRSGRTRSSAPRRHRRCGFHG